VEEGLDKGDIRDLLSGDNLISSLRKVGRPGVGLTGVEVEGIFIMWYRELSSLIACWGGGRIPWFWLKSYENNSDDMSPRPSLL
jgi:hypothetical protein